MFAWRLTRKAHADEPLAGEGARRYGGRWNHAGTAVVYSSETLSLAVLEYLVNLPFSDLPDDLMSIQFEFADDTPRTEIQVKDLPARWRTYPAIEDLKDLGDYWVREEATPILVVPSAVIPNERNYIINPAHREAKKIDVVNVEPFTLDAQLYAVKKSNRKRRTQ